MIQIIPAILETTEEGYKQTVEKVNQYMAVDEPTTETSEDWVQIDFTDNKFVSSQTVNFDVVAKYSLAVSKEAHLMVSDPENWIEKLAELDFQRVLIHLEVGNTEALLEKVRDAEMSVGLVLNPETEVSQVEPFLNHVDVVQIMSVKPGSQGQPFIPESNQKIKQLKSLQKNADFLIAVDGGLNLDTIKDVVDAGADHLVIGSFLLKGDMDENLEKIWEVLN